MREKKFRAWDKAMRRWVPQYSNMVVPIGSMSAWAEERGFELPEYTGLKDFNGVEIYEGDILIDDDYPEDDISYAEVRWVETEKHIGWKAYQWGFDKEYFTEYKVVGNKYENPELLNG